MLLNGADLLVVAKSSVRGLISLLLFLCKWMTRKGAVHSKDKQMRSLVSQAFPPSLEILSLISFLSKIIFGIF